MKTTEYFRNVAGFALPSPTRTSARGWRPKTFLLRGLTTLITVLGLAFAGLNSVYAVDFCVNPGFEEGTLSPPDIAQFNETSVPPWSYWEGTGGAYLNPLPDVNNPSARVWFNTGGTRHIAALNGMNLILDQTGTVKYHVKGQYYLPVNSLSAQNRYAVRMHCDVPAGTTYVVDDPYLIDDQILTTDTIITPGSWVTKEFDWYAPAGRWCQYIAWRQYGHGAGAGRTATPDAFYFDNLEFSSTEYRNDLTGLVKDKSGAPVAGATVTLSSANDPAIATATTAADGTYTCTTWVPFNNVFSVNATYCSKTGSKTGDGPKTLTVTSTAGQFPDIIFPDIIITPGDNVTEGPITAGPNGHCYQVVRTHFGDCGLITWDEAKVAAEQHTFGCLQGHLATITSEAEDVFIEALRVQFVTAAPEHVDPHTPAEFWVGGFQLPNQLTMNAGWYWINNEGPIAGINGGASYAKWLPNEPNDAPVNGVENNTENHLTVGRSGFLGWNDEGNLNLIYGYVIEYEYEDTQAPTIVCPPDLTVASDAGSCSATAVNLGTPQTSDNCSVASVANNAPASFPLGVTTVTWMVTDAAGNSAICEQKVTVFNPDPVVTLTGPASGSLYAVNTPVSFTASFTDAGGGPHTGTWTFDNLSQPATIVEPSGANAGSATATYTFTAPGVYRVTLTINDSCGGSGTADQLNGMELLVVVYDPTGGFVTGGGWINSPAGAYLLDLTLAGRANFGFVSKYQKGASVPVGETEFQFKVADLNFHSGTYQWLVIAGAKAQYKGMGQIDGAGNYGFLLTATDGQLNGGGGVDKFRIKIWDKNNGDVVVYDNVWGGSNDIDTANPQAIAGGSIVIHK